MGAALDDMAMLQHDDGVRVAHRGKPVCDDKHRAALHQAVHALLDQRLGAGVDARRGLVQNQHRRVGDGGAGDGQQLALSLAQVCAVARHHCVVALRQAADEGVGVRNFGRLFNFRLRRVQLAEADVVRHRAGEQVGVLQDNAQRAAQVVFLDEPHIHAVVGDGPARHLIKAVDEVGNRGLARARGADKGNFLPRLGVEREVLQNHPVRRIAKADVVEPHVAVQRLERDVGAAAVTPGPAARAPGALGQRTVVVFPHADQLHRALVDLRLFLHDREDTLRARQRRQQEVALLGQLVDGQRRLAHKDQIAGQAAEVGPAPHDHEAADHRNDRVVQVTDADDGGNHRGGVALRAGAGLAQLFVAGGKGGHVGLLVVEHLDDLLPGDHLLHVGVQLTEAGLLARIKGAAALCRVVDIPEHGNIANDDQQREPPVEDEQQKQRACDLNKGLDDHRKAVVQRVRDRVHVVREQAHQIALAVRVKVVQRQRLQMCEQVAADVLQNLLRGADHELGVAQGRQCADDVDARGQRHDTGQIGGTAVFQYAVDDGADHVGAQQRGQRTDRRQQADDAEHDFVAAQIVHEAAQRVPQVLRALTAEWLRHLRRPLSSGNGKFPDKSYLLPAARHACPRHAAARRPE